MLSLENQRFGEFEIVREIGRGGMGVVFEARQVSLNRRVALKVLNAGLGLNSKAIERFGREAEAAAKLHHTNIVPVYATGNQGDVHFYAMEMIDGPSLDRVIRQLRKAATSSNGLEENVGLDSAESPNLLTTLTMPGPVSEPAGHDPARENGTSSALSSDSSYFDRVSKMVAEVADALEHAHGHGVVHRDVKPSNLLLSSEGRLNLSDFGLARLLEKPGMTITGEFVGTPAYMSPEQVTAGRIPLDHRTDIYSLGATLYELLTLQRPFTGERRDQVLAQIVHKDPVLPRKVNRRVPVDLETICLKAMEKDPDRRYQTAGQMADDLRRFMNRFAIHARRAGPLERFSKWVRRHPAAAAAIAIAFLAAIAVSFFAYRAHLSEQDLRAERLKGALERTTEAAMRGKFSQAERALDEAIALGATTGDVRLLRGQIELHQGNTAKAIEHLEEAARLLPESVAVKALLMRAFMDAGQADRFYSGEFKLHQASPQSPEDYLFLGQVVSYVNPAKGLPLLDKAIELRDGPLPRLIRADVRTQYAQMTGKTEDAEQALNDVRVAQTLLPDDVLVLTASLQAHLVAACCFEIHQQKDRKIAELAKAKDLVSSLIPFPTNSKVLRARMHYYDYVNDTDAVRKLYLLERDRNGGITSQNFYFHQLYRQGEFAEAVKTLDARPRSENVAMYYLQRALALANYLPDGPALALAEYHAGMRTKASRTASYLPVVLFFVGQKKEANAIVKLHRHERLRASQGSGMGDPWTEKRTAHWAGLLSPEKLLEAAGDSLWWQCEAHFDIGLVSLSDGDRAGARRHFEAAVATRVLWFLEYQWCRSFLARMAADPTWPPWLPVKN